MIDWTRLLSLEMEGKEINSSKGFVKGETVGFDEYIFNEII